MDTDERFKNLASDPRFKTLKKKQRTVKIDERFQSMFTDSKFTLDCDKDKRGLKQKKQSGDYLRKYYSLEEETKEKEKKEVGKGEEGDEEEKEEEGKEEEEHEESEIESEEEEGAEAEDEEETGDDELDEESSEVSSSSDESESENDDEEGRHNGLVDRIQYDWQPLDHDAERTEAATRRLAIQNLDWHHLDVRDIYTLINSIRPPISVRVYISEFGKERLAKEEVDGPQELAEMEQIDEEEEDEECARLQNLKEAHENKDFNQKSFKANEYEDADEVIDAKNDEVRERIRRYQLSRLKYYYAIAEFDCVESAEAVYKELDGIEYEGSSLELDLRFVPDDMEFDSGDMKAECTKVPDLATYKAPHFISSALQQTTVKFTWDETDAKRQEKLQRAYTKEELEKDDLDAYLASDSEDEESGFDNTANGAASCGTDKYRELLKNLDEEAEKKKKIDVDVVWGDYEGDEKRTLASAELDKRPKKNKDKKKGKKDESNISDSEADADLDLLVMDAREREEFKFNPDDDRFGAVYKSGMYNIDPSHPKFKRTKAFDQIAEKKREKRWKPSRYPTDHASTN